MKYTAIIFDLFGTLVDNFSVREYFSVLDRMAHILGVPAKEFRQVWRDAFNERSTGALGHDGNNYRVLCEKLGVTPGDEQIAEAHRVRLDFTIKSLQPRPDTIATLETVRQRGLKTALVSDCTEEVPAIWQETPFAPLFDVTVFSCVAGFKKPDPRIYRLATDGLGVRPEECLYVGDGSSTELTGARKVGMHPVLIIDPGETVDTHYIQREENWDGPRISYLREVLDLI